MWTGTDSVSGLTVIALINAAGQATFIRGDGVQFTAEQGIVIFYLSVLVIPELLLIAGIGANSFNRRLRSRSLFTSSFAGTV